MTTYFSQKEFAAMRAEITGMAAVRWMALSGKPLTTTETKKLDETLESFFRSTGHRAFHEHGSSHFFGADRAACAHDSQYPSYR